MSLSLSFCLSDGIDKAPGPSDHLAVKAGWELGSVPQLWLDKLLASYWTCSEKMANIKASYAMIHWYDSKQFLFEAFLIYKSDIC